MKFLGKKKDKSDKRSTSSIVERSLRPPVAELHDSSPSESISRNVRDMLIPTGLGNVHGVWESSGLGWRDSSRGSESEESNRLHLFQPVQENWDFWHGRLNSQGE